MKPLMHLFTAAVTASLMAIAGGEAHGPRAQSHDPAGTLNQREDNLNVRYARTYLELARLELETALEENKMIRNMHSGATVQRLLNNVAIAKKQLKYAHHPDEHSLHEVHLQELEGDVALAELNLKNAIALNKHLPKAIGDLETRRMRVAAELTRLALAKARQPGAADSVEDHVQWQLSQLRTEVLRLQVRVEQLSNRK